MKDIITNKRKIPEAKIPPTKIASQCLNEFDNFMFKQDDFNAYFGRQLKENAYMIRRLGDYMH